MIRFSLYISLTHCLVIDLFRSSNFKMRILTIGMDNSYLGLTPTHSRSLLFSTTIFHSLFLFRFSPPNEKVSSLIQMDSFHFLLSLPLSLPLNSYRNPSIHEDTMVPHSMFLTSPTCKVRLFDYSLSSLSFSPSIFHSLFLFSLLQSSYREGKIFDFNNGLIMSPIPY